MGTPKWATWTKRAGLGAAGIGTAFIPVLAGGPLGWLPPVAAVVGASLAWWADRRVRRTREVTNLVAVLQQDPSAGYEGEVDEQGRPSLRFWGGKGRRRK
jgi:hypothetical protein